jgi:single-strand DNA-binding protein
MPSLNKVIIMGHLGQPPEIKKVGNINIANFSVATSEYYKDKDSGEKKQITEWHRVVLFNKLADVAENYLKKGDAIYLEGKLKTEKYTDKNNIEKYTTKIIGSNLQILSPKNKDRTATKKEPEFEDDDINF